MEILLTISTILGGIAAIGYFWDKHEKKRINVKTKKCADPSLPSNAALSAVLAKIRNSSSSTSKNYFVVRDVPIYEEPKLVRGKRIILTSRERKSLKKLNYDDPCAIISGQINWNDKPLTIHYSPAFYSEIQAMRKNGHRVIKLSVNALLISIEAQCIILHRRSEMSDDFPDTLHTFGGVLMPDGLTGRGDTGGIRECIERELIEEAGVAITVPQNTPIAVIDEQGIDFVQFTFLGVNISQNQLDRMRPNWEGRIVEIKFEDLYKRLKKHEEWTPTGWAHVALWLAIGGPGTNTQLKFQGMNAEELALAITDSSNTIKASSQSVNEIHDECFNKTNYKIGMDGMGEIGLKKEQHPVFHAGQPIAHPDVTDERKIEQKTSKDHESGKPNVIWAALKVFLAVIAVITVFLTAIGVYINYLQYQNQVSKQPDQKIAVKSVQKIIPNGNSDYIAPNLNKHALGETQKSKIIKSNVTHKSTDNTLLEESYGEEISASIKDSYTRFNQLVNMKMDVNNKIDKAFDDFFYEKDKNSSETYQKFSKFIKSLIDREITFKFIDVKDVSGMQKQKLHKVIVEGAFTIKGQYNSDTIKFTQIMVSENGKNWKFYGWL